jgi:nucleoside-triphosphatase THEP1
MSMAATLIAQANTLAETQGGAGRRRLYILSGDTGSGKTTRAAEVVERLRDRGLRVGGILAPGLLDNGRRTGFDILNLASGESAGLARDGAGGSASHAQWSRFSFSPEGLALGNRALGPDARGADVVLVDEVGPFELAGGGWASALDRIAREYTGILVLVVRASIVDAVKRRWGSADTVVWDAAATPADEIVEVITKAQERPSP